MGCKRATAVGLLAAGVVFLGGQSPARAFVPGFDPRSIVQYFSNFFQQMMSSALQEVSQFVMNAASRICPDRENLACRIFVNTVEQLGQRLSGQLPSGFALDLHRSAIEKRKEMVRGEIARLTSSQEGFWGNSLENTPIVFRVMAGQQPEIQRGVEQQGNTVAVELVQKMITDLLTKAGEQSNESKIAYETSLGRGVGLVNAGRAAIQGAPNELEAFRGLAEMVAGQTEQEKAHTEYLASLLERQIVNDIMIAQAQNQINQFFLENQVQTLEELRRIRLSSGGSTGNQVAPVGRPVLTWGNRVR